MSLAVVKLGGSSASSSDLPVWLDAVQAATQPLVLVPGGGPFADQVRDSQQALGYSDETAHAMALLAMEQFGHVLLGKAARLTAARSEAEIRLALNTGKIPLWFPSAMALADADIPASWDMTSDSLAAWLSKHIGAQALLLIKQSDDFSSADSCETLAARGIVDAAFPRFMPPVALHIAGPRHAAGAAATFARGELPGERISSAIPIRRAG